MIAEKLAEWKVPFIDCGLGIQLADSHLVGIVRLTCGTSAKSDHLWSRLPVNESGDEDIYSTNIQIADLNALNACLAVIRWKKLFGYYADQVGEHHATYTIDVGMLLNEETAHA